MLIGGYLRFPNLDLFPAEAAVTTVDATITTELHKTGVMMALQLMSHQHTDSLAHSRNAT